MPKDRKIGESLTDRTEKVDFFFLILEDEASEIFLKQKFSVSVILTYGHIYESK